MSMATSIESRVPFLDHEFVEFSTRVPAHMKLRNGEGKYIVKLVTGDMRMGLKESLVEDALGRMAGVPVESVQKVNMLVGDIGEVAVMARHGRLSEASMRLFHPLKFMLATPVEKPTDLVTEARGFDRPRLLEAAHQLGLPEIAVPRDVIEIDHMPLLGTGKTDYAAVTRLAEQAIAAPSTQEPALSLVRG